MHCEIKWRNMTHDEWDVLFKKCTHTPITQSYYYAQAMRESKQQGVRHGIILIDGAEAGIVQMQEVRLFGQIIHGLSIDRGPCWFKNFGTLNHLTAFATTLDTQFPDRFGRKRRFLPEFQSKNQNISLNNWIKNQKIPQYNTFMIDLSPTTIEIRKNLKKNWRNYLSKSEKGRITIKKDDDLSTLSSFLKFYTRDRLEKQYSGTSARFLAAMAKYAAFHNDCFILNATEDGQTIGSVIIFTHGNSATYQAGWTTPYGRNKGAHHLLLWETIKILKSQGILAFDLGGYNNDADGITAFKAGLGGHAIALIGSYS